jgi:hypothetical protein
MGAWPSVSQSGRAGRARWRRCQSHASTGSRDREGGCAADAPVVFPRSDRGVATDEPRTLRTSSLLIRDPHRDADRLPRVFCAYEEQARRSADGPRRVSMTTPDPVRRRVMLRGVCAGQTRVPWCRGNVESARDEPVVGSISTGGLTMTQVRRPESSAASYEGALTGPQPVRRNSGSPVRWRVEDCLRRSARQLAALRDGPKSLSIRCLSSHMPLRVRSGRGRVSRLRRRARAAVQRSRTSRSAASTRLSSSKVR